MSNESTLQEITYFFNFLLDNNPKHSCKYSNLLYNGFWSGISIMKHVLNLKIEGKHLLLIFPIDNIKKNNFLIKINIKKEEKNSLESQF